MKRFIDIRARFGVEVGTIDYSSRAVNSLAKKLERYIFQRGSYWMDLNCSLRQFCRKMGLRWGELRKKRLWHPEFYHEGQRFLLKTWNKCDIDWLIELLYGTRYRDPENEVMPGVFLTGSKFIGPFTRLGEHYVLEYARINSGGFGPSIKQQLELGNLIPGVHVDIYVEPSLSDGHRRATAYVRTKRGVWRVDWVAQCTPPDKHWCGRKHGPWVKKIHPEEVS